MIKWILIIIFILLVGVVFFAREPILNHYVRVVENTPFGVGYHIMSNESFGDYVNKTIQVKQNV